MWCSPARGDLTPAPCSCVVWLLYARRARSRVQRSSVRSAVQVRAVLNKSEPQGAAKKDRTWPEDIAPAGVRGMCTVGRPCFAVAISGTRFRSLFRRLVWCENHMREDSREDLVHLQVPVPPVKPVQKSAMFGADPSLCRC